MACLQGTKSQVTFQKISNRWMIHLIHSGRIIKGETINKVVFQSGSLASDRKDLQVINVEGKCKWRDTKSSLLLLFRIYTILGSNLQNSSENQETQRWDRDAGASRERANITPLMAGGVCDETCCDGFSTRHQYALRQDKESREPLGRLTVTCPQIERQGHFRPKARIRDKGGGQDSRHVSLPRLYETLSYLLMTEEKTRVGDGWNQWRGLRGHLSWWAPSHVQKCWITISYTWN